MNKDQILNHQNVVSILPYRFKSQKSNNHNTPNTIMTQETFVDVDEACRICKNTNIRVSTISFADRNTPQASICDACEKKLKDEGKAINEANIRKAAEDRQNQG